MIQNGSFLGIVDSVEHPLTISSRQVPKGIEKVFFFFKVFQKFVILVIDSNLIL